MPHQLQTGITIPVFSSPYNSILSGNTFALTYLRTAIPGDDC